MVKENDFRSAVITNTGTNECGSGRIIPLEDRENGWINQRESFEHQKMREALGKMDESIECFHKQIHDSCIKVKSEEISPVSCFHMICSKSHALKKITFCLF